jgi:hypothetical protein
VINKLWSERPHFSKIVPIEEVNNEIMEHYPIDNAKVFFGFEVACAPCIVSVIVHAANRRLIGRTSSSRSASAGVCRVTVWAHETVDCGCKEGSGGRVAQDRGD